MSNPSYSEKLRDPRWQRRRLECLDAAGWECESCGDPSNTLHVHHKRYIKGKNPWEYQNDDLIVLCADCHDSHHYVMERLKEMLARVDPATALALICGYWKNSDWIDPGLIEDGRQQDPITFAAGLSASFIQGDIDKIYKVAEFSASLTREDSEERQILRTNKHLFGKEE